MKHLSLLFVCLGLIGCAPEWNGTFVGTLNTTGFCSDGSSVPESSTAAQVTLVDNGDTVSWEAACGATLIADINNDQADVRQASCPATTDTNGVTSSTTVKDGTLTLNDNSLEMDLELSLILSGALTGSCSLTGNGTLKRLEE